MLPPEVHLRCATGACLCGRSAPTLAHLAWACPATQAKRLQVGVRAPANRAEERLLSPVQMPRPRPPAPLDLDATRRQLRLLAETHRSVSPDLVLATDGGGADGNVSWAVYIPDVGGISDVGDLEDTTAFVGEVLALKFRIAAVREVWGSGRLVGRSLTLTIDCLIAMTTVSHAPGLLSRGRLLQSAGATTRWAPIPNHGKTRSRWRPLHGFSESNLRNWNDLAERLASAKLEVSGDAPDAQWMRHRRNLALWQAWRWTLRSSSKGDSEAFLVARGESSRWLGIFAAERQAARRAAANCSATLPPPPPRISAAWT